MSKKQGTRLTNPIEIHKVTSRLKNAYITKAWDSFDSAVAIDCLEQLANSYEIMMTRYFSLINIDISDLDKLKELYFIDETEAQIVYLDEEKH